MEASQAVDNAGTEWDGAPPRGFDSNPDEKARARQYVFTCFDERWVEAPQAFARYMQKLIDAGKISAFVFQLERCAKTQRLHLQGGVQCAKATRFTSITTALGFVDGRDDRDPANVVWRKGSGWFRVAHGTGGQVWNYCTKEETSVLGDAGRFSGGEFDRTLGQRGVGRGDKRQSSNEIGEAIIKRRRDGAEEADIALEFPGAALLHPGGVRYLIQHAQPKPVRREPVVLLLYGASGCGKTHTVETVLPKEGSVYNLPTSRDGRAAPWGDDSASKRVWVINELQDGNLPPSFLKMAMDPQPFAMEVKNSKIWVRPDLLLLTATWNPLSLDTTFLCDGCDLPNFYAGHQRYEEQWATGMKRRITKIFKFPAYETDDNSPLWKHPDNLAVVERIKYYVRNFTPSYVQELLNPEITTANVDMDQEI